MRVIHLSLADFRNYRSAEVEFVPGHNLILGRNGQGKTNLIEAIGYFSALRSHRVSGDTAMILAGADHAVARMRIGVKEREAVLEVQLNRVGQNRARVNGNSVRSNELTRWFSSVLFAPEDLAIVRGEPSVRRRFLDDAVIARNPAMAGVLSDYERVVRQRTALLKSARLNRAGGAAARDATLSVWNSQLVSFGSRIMHERRQLLAELLTPLAAGYAQLVEQDHSPSIALLESALTGNVSRETINEASIVIEDRPVRTGTDVSRETIESEFFESLERVKNQELERAVTLVGPHRDDFLAELNGLPVKGYASHGESWSFALSLKLALAALLREESAAGDPVIVLDDVFAELDAGRRDRLMAAVGDYEQVIVTAAVEEDLPPSADWHIVRVHAGQVVGEGTADGKG